ncbi:MAG: hypothetical protein RIR59_1500 [Pseudomonadota bacterium]
MRAVAVISQSSRVTPAFERRTPIGKYGVQLSLTADKDVQITGRIFLGVPGWMRSGLQ